MSSDRRRVVALALAALVAGGCSGEPAGSGEVAARATAHEKAVNFAECMRENGVREFPDPDASGRMTVDGVLNGSSLDPTAPAWKAASAACEDLQPPGFTGDDDFTDEQMDARLEFARCMRENGIRDFPDPVDGGPLIDTTRIPSAKGRGALGIPGFQEAMEACRGASDRALDR